ncbi:MAG: hypothetical protein GXX96_27470 [Planctomycetaceae bacterium]|nr:hypothetical protein [Planctomycetaceae bacterium]
MCAHRARAFYDREAEKRKLSGKKAALQDNCPEPPKGQARDQVGQAFGVSGKSVDRAARVVRAGIPELAAAVDASSPWPTTEWWTRAGAPRLVK